MKKISNAGCLFLILWLLISTASAMHGGSFDQPRYTRIRTFAATLTISESGYATCYSQVKSTDSSDTIDLTMELQQSTDGRHWNTIKSWDISDSSNIVDLDKGWYVSSGYYYQILATAEVYTSSGIWQETASTNSLVTNF